MASNASPVRGPCRPGRPPALVGVRVRYEDLVTDWAGEAARLGHFLGLDLKPAPPGGAAAVAGHRTTSDAAASLGRWKRERLPAGVRERLESLLPDFLAAKLPGLLAAIALLRKTPGIDPKRVYVLGHSLGAMMAPKLATLDPQLAGIIVMAGPTRPLEDLMIDQLAYLENLQGELGWGETRAQSNQGSGRSWVSKTKSAIDLPEDRPNWASNR